MYLLDTDIAIFAIRGNKTVLQRLANLLSGQWAISTITAFEIQKGLEAHPNTRSSAKAQLFLANVEPLMFDVGAAAQAAKVFNALKQTGRPIGTTDELIAGHALSLRATLVTNNLKHFQRVPGLKVEGWL